jgi:hypothetical protein
VMVCEPQRSSHGRASLATSISSRSTASAGGTPGSSCICKGGRRAESAAPGGAPEEARAAPVAWHDAASARATLRRERAGRPRQQVGQDNCVSDRTLKLQIPRKPDAAQSSSARPVACEKNRSALVRRLISARDDPAKLRIRHLLSGMSDDRLLSLGLTAQDIVLVRGAASAPD